MFPDLRLMIAAMLASVVVLICGFGMFAAFRVSHEPLVRLATAGSPLQVFADPAAGYSLAFGSGEPFDRRFQIVALQSFSPSPPALGPDHASSAETMPLAAAATELKSAVPDETVAPGEPNRQAALDASQPAEIPAGPADEAPASDRASLEPEPAAAAATSASDAAVPAPTAAAEEAGQQTKEEMKSTAAAEPVAESAAALSVATTAPATVAPLSHERPNRDAQQTSVASPAPQPARVAVEKRAWHQRVIVRIGRARSIAHATAAAAAEQSSGFAQSDFQTGALPQSQFSPRRLTGVRRTTFASGPTRDPRAAIGGPYVSAPNR